MNTFFKSPMHTLTASLFLVFTVVVAGCHNNDDDHDDEVLSNLTQITSGLSGQQEVPAVLGSTASGTSAVFLDEATGDISGYVEGSNLSGSITAAHIHEANAGQNGGPIITLIQDADNLNRFNIPDGSTLTTAQLASLQQGGMYFNMHTANNPGGEIRGQIAPTGFKLITNQVNGTNQVPAITTNASATSYISYSSGSTVVSINVVTTGLVATAAHMHKAFAGSNGGSAVIVGLTQDPDNLDLWSAEAELSAEDFASFKAGEAYINVHSSAYPGGEIRGQVTPANITVTQTTLDGSQEVPAVTSTASGVAYTTFNTATRAIHATVIVSGADDATAAHIHQAAAGSNGSVILPLTQDASDVTVWQTASGATLDEAQATALEQSMMYFNIHTPANGSGEIRGQIVTGTSTTSAATTTTTTY